MKRPKIIVNVVSSVDGRISIRPNMTMFDQVEDFREKDDKAKQLWTEVGNKIKSIHKPQGDMLGSNSLVRKGEKLKELPKFNGDSSILYQDYLPDEVINRPSHKGWLIAVDGKGRLRSGYRGEDNLEWHMLHLVSHSVPCEYLAFLRENRIPYLVEGKERVDLKEVMKKMKAKLNISTVVTSAGGNLSGVLLKRGLIDEVNIIFKPAIYGGFETPSLFDSPELKKDELPTELELINTQVESDGYIWLRYKVK